MPPGPTATTSPSAVADTAALLLDAAGTVVALTPAAEALLGLRSSDVCGRPVRELLTDADGWAALIARGGGARVPDVPDEGPGETPDGTPEETCGERPDEGPDERPGASGTSGTSGASPAPAGGRRAAPAVRGRGKRAASAGGRGKTGVPGPAAGWEGRATLRHGSGHDLDVGFGVLPLDQGRGDGPARFLVVGAPADALVRWRQDRALTRELFLQGRVGLALFDAGLRLLRTNTHLLPYTGLPADLGGRRLGDFLRGEDADVIDAQQREVLRTGTPLIGFSAAVGTPADPRGGRELSFSAFRLLESDGRAMGVATVFTDVTDHQRARGRLALLYRATEALSGSLSVMRTVEDLAGVLAPALGDCAAVDLAEPVLTGGEPPADGRHTLVLLRMAVAGAEDGGPRTGTAHTQPVDGPGSPGPGAFAGDGHGLLVTGLGRDTVPHADGRDTPSPADGRDTPSPAGGAPEWTGAVPGAHSAMAAPLRARGIMFGRLLVWRTGTRPVLDPDDLTLLEEIASRAALAVDNARRYTKERRTAVGLQRSLLPPATCERPALEAAGAYLPADAGSGVGGDWFDVIPLSSARVALVVGDVAGHGLYATAMMGRLRSAVRALADLDLEPEELLAHLDDLVLQVAAEAESEEPGDGDAGIPLPGGPVGATCLYAVYDPVTRQCVMASAGRPPARSAEGRRHAAAGPYPRGPRGLHRHLAARRRPRRHRGRAPSRPGAAEPVGPRRTGLHHRADRQRARHQRHPLRGRSRAPQAHPYGHPDVRGLRSEQHPAQDAPGPDVGGGRPRPLPRRPALPPLGQPLHQGGQDGLVRAAPAPRRPRPLTARTRGGGFAPPVGQATVERGAAPRYLDVEQCCRRGERSTR